MNAVYYWVRQLPLLATISIGIWPACVFGQVVYHVTDLGTLGGTESYAYGINNSGQVVGYSFTSGVSVTTKRAFRTQPNAVIDPLTDNLGTLGGFSSFAAAINDLGQVVGNSYLSNNSTSHAFRTEPNAPINAATNDLGTLGGGDSSAWGINNLGEVVGNSFVPGNGYVRAFRTGPNAAINPATDNLGSLGGSESGAWGINESGQVVGYAFLSGNTIHHAFRTTGRTAINSAADIGGAVGSYSDARGINDTSQAVGSAYFGGITSHNAFRTGPNAPINPTTDNLGRPTGTTASALLGINASGWSVGYVSTSSASFYHAIMHNGTSIIDLNDVLDNSGTGWILKSATAINEHNQIVGYGTINGVTHAFRLDLVVPEPSAWLLTMCGVFICLLNTTFRQ